MQIDKLRSFTALCETKSMTQCAKQIHISQQGLSRQIRSMEEELCTPLFQRSSRGIKLTREGELLRPYFEQAVRQYDQGISELQKLKSDFRQILNVAVCPGIEHALGLEFFIRFQRKNPQIHLNFYFASDEQCEQDLLDKKADAAFLDAPEKEELYFCHPIVHSQCVAVVKKDHEFAKKESISFFDLKGKTVYIPDHTHRKTGHFEKAYPELFHSINLSYASNEYDTYFRLPKYFDGIGLTFHFLCDHLENELTEVPIKEPSFVSLVYCVLKGSRNTAAEMFTDYVRCSVPKVIT